MILLPIVPTTGWLAFGRPDIAIANEPQKTTNKITNTFNDLLTKHSKASTGKKTYAMDGVEEV